MDFKNITDKIEDMLKDRIIELGLVKTGKLLKSIRVTESDGEFTITAEDYFTVLDEEYNISEYVFNSDELTDFIEEDITIQLQKEIDEI